jgi:hypothetical protein
MSWCTPPVRTVVNSLSYLGPTRIGLLIYWARIFPHQGATMILLISANAPDPRFPISTYQLSSSGTFSSVIDSPRRSSYLSPISISSTCAINESPVIFAPLTNSFAYTGSLPIIFLLPISNQIDLSPPSASDR